MRILLKFFIIILLPIVFSSTFRIKIPTVFAATGGLVGFFHESNTGTVWQVRARVTDPVTGTSGWYYDLTNNSGTYCSSAPCAIIDFGTHDISSRTDWATACVDPSNTYSAGVLCSTCSPIVYGFQVDVTCPVGATSVGGLPASCSDPNNKGTVYFNSWCPSGPYCMYAGLADAAQYCGGPNGPFAQTPQVNGTIPSSCTNSGSCTYAYCSNPGSPDCNINAHDNTGTYCGSSCIPPSCPSGQSNPHNTCSGTTCTSVSGCGINGCPNGSSDCTPTCPSGQSNPHNVCSGTTCTSVSGCGISSCSGNASCGACTAGTGSTNASCGGFDRNAIQASSGLCCQYTYRCVGNTCTSACHDTSIDQSLCSVTPPPVSCQQCISSSCQTYSTSNCNTSCGSGCSTPPGTCP